MKKVILLLLAFFICWNTYSQSPLTCVSCSLMTNCFQSANISSCGCGSWRTPVPYYNSFPSIFNPKNSNGCWDWHMAISQNNCQNIPFNFNYSRPCNDNNLAYLWGPAGPVKNQRLRIFNPGRLGGSDNCVKLTCFKDDTFQSDPDNSRAELVVHPQMQENQWQFYSWSFKLPLGFGYEYDNDINCPAVDNTHHIIAQFHTTDPVPTTCTLCYDHSIPFNINIRPYNSNGTGPLTIFVNYGAEDICSPIFPCNKNTPNIGSVELNEDHWYDVVLAMYWSSNPLLGQMRITIYDNDPSGSVTSQTFNSTKANMFTDLSGTAINNDLQLGIYRGKNQCKETTILIDEFSLAKRYLCCLYSPQLHHCDACDPLIQKTGSDSYMSNTRFKVSPNPTSGIIKLETDYEIEARLSLVLYNTLSQKVFEFTFIDQSNFINLKLAPGIYSYAIYDHSNLSLQNGKIVIQ